VKAAVRMLARGAVGLAAGAGAICLDGRPALADEFFAQTKAVDHTFVSTGGGLVTCQVSGSSALTRPPGRPAYFGEATTSIDTASPACRGFVSVEVTYVDPNGARKSAGARGAETFANWHGDDVGTDFDAFHRVFFFECTQNCEFTVTTRPK
jgi:hypothetical protein